MNSKITGVYLGILGAIIISVLLYIDFSTERIYQDDPRFFADHPNAVPDHVLTGIKSIEEISLTRIVEVERETIFKIMADVNNYPYILPKNIISVEILEQDESTIIAEEEIIEQGIRAKLLVKHTFIPYEKQIIEILEGDAKGTKITANFVQLDNSTEITTDVDLELHGILSPFGFLAKGNINSAMNTVILTFSEYAKGNLSDSEKIVDDIFREILYRPAEPQALHHFSKLIDTKQITEDDLRKELLESEEFKNSLFPHEVRNIEDLSQETKNFIHTIYLELLNRTPDSNALQYFGSLIESKKMTEDDLRNAILQSEEYAYVNDLLIVDNVTVQDGIPIILSWPLDLTPASSDSLIKGFVIYRDSSQLEEIIVNDVCFNNTCAYKDHSVVEGYSYSYQITPFTENYTIAAGSIDKLSHNFSYQASLNYPSFTGVAQILILDEP